MLCTDGRNHICPGHPTPNEERSTLIPKWPLKVLHAKIGELALENDFYPVALSKAGLLTAKR